MNTLPATVQSNSSLAHQRGDLTREQADLLKRTVCRGATDDEFALFVAQCNRTRLDPFSRQIHAVKRWDSKEGREVMAIQVGIDGFRLVAERTGHYAGQRDLMWCGKDGVWRDSWLEDEPPFAAKATVLRDDFKEPCSAVARWTSYVQEYFDKKNNQRRVGPMWAKMPEVMLGKCAEALALRKAFPQELSGLYTPDEMGQADNARAVRIEASPGDQPQGFDAREQAEIDATFGGKTSPSATVRRVIAGIPIGTPKTWEQVATLPVRELFKSAATSDYKDLTLGEMVNEDADDGRVDYLEQELVRKAQDLWSRMPPAKKATGLDLPYQYVLIAYDELQSRRSPPPNDADAIVPLEG